MCVWTRSYEAWKDRYERRTFPRGKDSLMVLLLRYQIRCAIACECVGVSDGRYSFQEQVFETAIKPIGWQKEGCEGSEMRYPTRMRCRLSRSRWSRLEALEGRGGRRWKTKQVESRKDLLTCRTREDTLRLVAGEWWTGEQNA